MKPAVYDFIRSFSRLYMIIVLVLFALGAVGSGFVLKAVVTSTPFGSPVNLVGYLTPDRFFGYVFDSSGNPVGYTVKLYLTNGSSLTYSGKGKVDFAIPPGTVSAFLNTTYGRAFQVYPGPGYGLMINLNDYYINGNDQVDMPLGKSTAYISFIATDGQSYSAPQNLIVVGFNVSADNVSPLTFNVYVQGKNETVNGFGVLTVKAEHVLDVRAYVDGVETPPAQVADSVPSTFVTIAFTAFVIMVGLISAVFPLVSLYSTLLNVVRSIESGSLKFLVAQPVKRYQIVFNRYLASLLTIVVVAVVFGAITYFESETIMSPYGVSFPPSAVLGFALAVILPQAAYLSLLLLIAAVVSRGWQFSILSFTAYVLVFYVIPITVSVLGIESQLLGLGSAQNYDWLYYIGFGGLSGYIFSKVSGVVGLVSISLPLPAVVADLIAWIIVPLVLAVYRFNRRDF